MSIWTNNPARILTGRSTKKPLRKNETGRSALYILSIDRLGRNYEWKSKVKIWRVLTKEKRHRYLRDWCRCWIPDKRKKIWWEHSLPTLFLQILLFVAQSERENIQQEVVIRYCRRKAKGVKFGRPERKYPTFGKARFRLGKEENTLSEIFKQCNMSEATLSPLAEHRINGNNEQCQIAAIRYTLLITPYINDSDWDCWNKNVASSLNFLLNPWNLQGF